LSHNPNPRFMVLWYSLTDQKDLLLLSLVLLFTSTLQYSKRIRKSMEILICDIRSLTINLENWRRIRLIHAFPLPLGF
jgi:hypothetical protein